MPETQISEPSPEELIVDNLTRDAERAMHEYGLPVEEDTLPEGFEGTMDRALSPDGHVLTRAISPEGTVSYQLSAPWNSTNDRGSLNRRWFRGGDVIAASNSSEMNGTTEEYALDVDDMRDVGLEVRTSFSDEASAPAGRFRGSRPRVEEGELAAVDDVSEQGLEDEKAERAAEYERRLSTTEERIDAWIEDPGITWRPQDRKINPDGNRYIEYRVPSDDGQSWLQTRVAVIDETGKNRWYVMHVTHGQSTLIMYWQKGGELVRARRADVKEPHEANLGEMGLAEKVTDPKQAHIKRRKPEASAEDLENGSKLAHQIGRILGSKTVTRWR